MAELRIPRDSDTRENNSRPAKWMPPTLLPEINQDPGYAYRYVRVSTLGETDANNVSAKFREGWEPVKASDHPEAYATQNPDSRYKDAIETGGLILCRIPKEYMDQRAEHYSKLTEDQVSAVDNAYMRDEDHRMPKFSERDSKVTFGKGKP